MAATTPRTLNPPLHNRTHPKSSLRHQNPIKNIKPLSPHSAKHRRVLPLVASLQPNNGNGSQGQNQNAVELRRLLEDFPYESNSKDLNTLPSQYNNHTFLVFLISCSNFDLYLNFFLVDFGIQGLWLRHIYRMWFLMGLAFEWLTRFGTFCLWLISCNFVN